MTETANIYRTPPDSLDTKARISSRTSNSFILRVKIPAFSHEEIDALVDSGATRCFIDYSLTNCRPDALIKLPAPIPCELFDGSPINPLTHVVQTQLSYADGTTHREQFFPQQVHPSVKVVLGMSWLRKWNPTINWADLTLRFPESLRAISMTVPSLNDPVDHVLLQLLDPEPRSTATRDSDASETLEAPSKPQEPSDAHKTSKTDHVDHSKPVSGEDDAAPSKKSPPSATSAPTDSAKKPPAISLISAAAFHLNLKRGETAYVFHCKPAQETEALRASIAEEDLPTATPIKSLDELVPIEYRDFADVFSEEIAREMPPHRSYDHKIELEEGATPPVGRVYNMSAPELNTLKDYINEMLGKGFIRASNSPAGAPVLFIKKKDGSLRLCVDYRGLNKITRKNRYPIPLVGNLIDQLREAKIYSKIDLRAGYNNVRITDGQEWLTAFRTRYGSFEYLVMPFGLTNAPATFQYFMNDIFHDMIDVHLIIYLDDLLIYSKDEETHRHHVRQVLERLRQYNLHARPEKCEFHTKSVEYLGVIVSPEGVRMDPLKVKAILDWPAPTKVKELQSFLGFANFYRRFLDNYSGIVVPLTRLLRKNTPWRWGEKQQTVFDLLKEAFTTAPVLRHFDPTLPCIVEADASDFAVAAILSQIDPITNEIRPVAFHARTMISAELNYDIYDKELLAIHESFKQWRCYLEGSPHTTQVYSDHNNLQYFTTTKQLSRRQARWSEYLSGFDFIIHYRPGRLGTKPDALTRRADVYPKKSFQADANAFNRRVAIPPEQLNAILLLNEEFLLNKIKSAPPDEHFEQGRKKAESTQGPFELSPDGLLLLHRGKIYVPDHKDLRYQVLRDHHDHKLRGHPGIRKTTQLIMRTYYWPRIRRDVTSYVRACHPCARAKASRHSPYGLLKPLPIGERPWSSISMDHIDQLPSSDGHDAILVVMCRLTKQAIIIPTHTTDTAVDLANYFIQHVFSKHGLPADVISDRGHLFVSRFWKALCKALDITSNLSTAFHPQTDGQTERTNQTLEQYLRIYVNYQQDDWKHHLPIAEFVYNNTPHSAIGMSPFFANKGFNPRLTISLDDIPAHEAHKIASDLKSLHTHLREQIQVANKAYARFEDPYRSPTPDWPIGTLVWLDWRNIKTKRPMKKLDHKRHGPFEIIKKVSTHAYQIKLPASFKGIHDVFHVSLLEKVAEESYPQRRPDPPPPVEIEGELEYEVAEILDSRRRRGVVKYLVRWEGYGSEDDTWEPVEMLEGSRELLDEFHAKYPQKPRADLIDRI